MEELQEVVGWYDVGIFLKVPRHMLETIRKDYRSTNECKQAMFSWWLNNTLEKKWSAIVLALSKTGYHSLATTLAYSHSECVAVDGCVEDLLRQVFCFTGVPVPCEPHVREVDSDCVEDTSQVYIYSTCVALSTAVCPR